MTDGVRRAALDRVALAALCLLLGLSVALRLLPSGDTTTDPEAAGRPVVVDLGHGVVLQGAVTAPRDVLVGACWTPIPVAFVQPSPHGTDTSLAGPRSEGDRVTYAYHGRMLSGRFASTELAVLHFVRRGVSVLSLNRIGAGDGLAVKLTMPVGCGAAPEEALEALRREVRAGG